MRVQKSDLVPAGAGSRFFIDKAEASRGQLFECRSEVGDAVGDVVQAGAAPVQELLHRRLFRARFDQFNPGTAAADEGDIYVLGRDGLGRSAARGGNRFENRQSRGDGWDRNSDVIERQFQGRSGRFLAGFGGSEV
jgi:hypothetical protein